MHGISTLLSRLFLQAWANVFECATPEFVLVNCVGLISRFDPWRSGLCTCPSKLTFNPYTGCDHACTYCYASSYVPRFSDCRPKKDLIQRLAREAEGLRGEIVSISNSSDPYPFVEEKMGLMRECLKILSGQDCRVQIVTKSSLVTRDVDLLRKVRSMVSLTVTTDDDCTARLIEPRAPLPSARLKAIGALIGKGVPVSVRVDPVVPFVNDDVEGLVRTLSSLGVRHVTSSTFKVRPDGWRRFSGALPEVAERLKPLYFREGVVRSGYRYLPETLRSRLMERVGELAGKYGMRFGTCREGFGRLNTAVCDGSWMLNEGAS
jgi:DNA repair photolyase